MKVKFVAEEKYRPQYANETDACMDLKAEVNLDETERRSFTFDNGFSLCHYEDTQDTLYIKPNQLRVISSGVQAAVPEGYVMQMFVRSSTGIKKNLVLANGTGIIDAGYRDTIKMALYNTGNNVVEVKDGDRLCQFVIIPFPKIEPEFVEDNEAFRTGDRGGGIGSTGN